MKDIKQQMPFRKPVLDHEIPLDRRQFAFQIAKSIWPNSIDTSEKNTYLTTGVSFQTSLTVGMKQKLRPRNYFQIDPEM